MNISSGVAAIQLSPAFKSKKVYIHPTYNQGSIKRIAPVKRRHTPVMPETPIGKNVRQRMSTHKNSAALYTIKGQQMYRSPFAGKHLDVYA